MSLVSSQALPSPSSLSAALIPEEFPPFTFLLIDPVLLHQDTTSPSWSLYTLNNRYIVPNCFWGNFELILKLWSVTHPKQASTDSGISVTKLCYSGFCSCHVPLWYVSWFHPPPSHYHPWNTLAFPSAMLSTAKLSSTDPWNLNPQSDFQLPLRILLEVFLWPLTKVGYDSKRGVAGDREDASADG